MSSLSEFLSPCKTLIESLSVCVCVYRFEKAKKSFYLPSLQPLMPGFKDLSSTNKIE